MPAHAKSRGDEPSMFLQRPSTGKSQDVRHILVRTFRDVFTRDAIGPDTVKNLSVSKGGDDPYHERYVDALQKVFDERKRRMEEVAMLERHIMQAQARAMSADERQLNRAMQSCDNYTNLGLPPVDTSFKRCLDTSMLKKHNLLTPDDYSTEEPPPNQPPKIDKVPSYARDTITSRQHTMDDLFLDQEKSHPDLPVRSKSEIGSVVSEEPLEMPEQAPPPPSGFTSSPEEKENTKKQHLPRNDAWKQQMSEEKREIERSSLNRLDAMVNYQRNPRFVPPSAPTGGRTLLKPKQVKAKEIGIQPKPDELPVPQEPSQVFLVSPPSVIFSDYKVGQVYELTLTLKNVSSCIRQCRALPASTQYFSIGLGQFPGEHGLVAPGMSCHYAIRFNPDSLRDFYDEIRIQTQSRDPIIVPIMGRRPPPKLTIPPVLDLGHCLVGGCHVTQFLIKNEGGPGRFCIMPSIAWPTTNFKSVVRNGSVAIPPFDVRPSVLDIAHNQTGIMEIVFQPPALKSYAMDMCLVCDNCHVRHFTIKGEAQRAGVELVSVERGLSEAAPGELTDATAQVLIKFDQLNPFTYTDRTATIKNTTNVSLPFQWMIYKPQFDSPGAESPNKKYDRVPDVDSVFSVHPPTGVLPPAETMEFKLTYAPPVVDKFHSTLHMLLNMVPACLEPPTSKKDNSAGGSDKGDNADQEEDEEDNISEIMVQHGDTPPFGDVTALEIEVKGESTPLSVVLHPYSIYVPGKHLVGTTLKKMVTMANHSHSTITFQWEPYTEKYLLEVEPPFGELDPGMAMDMELCITGPQPGKIDHTLYCHVMNLEDPLHLKIQAEYKGPEVSIDEPDLNFGLVRLGQTVKKTITLNNKAQIITPWSIRDSPAIPVSDDEMALSEFEFEPPSGQLKPLESQVVTVTFSPVAQKSLKRVIEVLVEDGADCNIACYAEVQSPAACLAQCEINIPRVYKGVPVMATAHLLNQTLMPAAFEWGKVFGEDSKDCSIELDPGMGTLGGREDKPINISFTASREGDFSDLRIPCKVEGIEQPLIMALFADVKGLSVAYDVSKDGREPMKLGTSELAFGEVELNSMPKLYLHIVNQTAITCQYTVGLETFFAKPPTPPGEKKEEAARRAISTRRLMLGKTPNLADPLSKTPGKAQADLNVAMLSQGQGTSFVPQPAEGILSAFGEEVIEVTAFSDMWGEYNDNIICKIGDLEETKIPVRMTVVGCPLTFQMTSGLPDLKPVVRFGTHVAGTQACNRVMRVKNNSPYDIRVDWQVFNIEDGDVKLMDMVICYGKPFPLLDDDGNEIPPPTEAPKPKKIVPMPVIREPTDYIPNSADTSANPSREMSHVTQATYTKDNTDVSMTTSEGDQKRPKVVSVFTREHHGQLAPAPYSIRPRQLVVPAKGHASVCVTFTPHPTQEVTEDMDCTGFILGYLSLDSDKARGQEGKVTRPQAYLTSQLHLDMTAHLKPALLTLECGDEEGMRYRSAMSCLLKEDGQLQAESLKVSSVMLSNLTLTPLTFRLVTKKPFMLVELDPHSTREGTTRAQSTEFHSLKPRHNLVVKVAFQTTSSLLSEIAEDYMNNEDVGENGRKIELQDNLTVEFNNGGTQLVPLHATLTVPQFELSKESLDFGVCLVGQTREMQLLITNTTSSHTVWSVSQESRSDSCAADTFSMSPTSGQLEAHITHISNSKSLLKVYFTAKHAEDYDAVFAFHGILGETPRRLYVRAEGSYDGKHEAILNV